MTSATTTSAKPIRDASRNGKDPFRHETHDPLVLAKTSLDQDSDATQLKIVEEGIDVGQPSNETQSSDADIDPTYFSLLFAADFLDDMEKARIAMQNRLRSLGQVKELDNSPWAMQFQIQLDKLIEMEKEATKQLQKAIKTHPLGSFIKQTIGLGEKQVARLLAATGDPGARPNVAKLWAYCGFHVIDGKRPRRTKGQKSNWSNTAKMRARLCAESCIKQMHSPYRKIYDREREKWSSRETSDLHKHNHALSVVAKEILKDLWIESTRLKVND